RSKGFMVIKNRTEREKQQIKLDEAERFRQISDIVERLTLENQALKVVLEEQNKFKKTVDQVVHDIRSPIAAMRMILRLCNGLPENLRVSLNQSAIRIADIANNLINNVKPEEDWTEEWLNRAPTLISADLLEIVTEKKYEYSKLPLDFISKISPSGYVAFINIDTKAFKRTLSNLINNAVDAFDGKNGEIIIYLDVIDNKVQIIIEDNGKGMPDEVKNKILNNIAVTAGKANGHGIGFSQIHDVLDSNDGTLEIESETDVGTKIILTFPLIENPELIAEKILESACQINTTGEAAKVDLVYIEDDKKFASMFKRVLAFEDKVMDTYSGVGEFLGNISKYSADTTIILMDNQFEQENITGIELAKQLHERGFLRLYLFSGTDYTGDSKIP